MQAVRLRNKIIGERPEAVLAISLLRRQFSTLLTCFVSQTLLTCQFLHDSLQYPSRTLLQLRTAHVQIAGNPGDFSALEIHA